MCGKEINRNDKFEIHHIHPFALGGKDLINNLTVLCKECHKEIHKMIMRNVNNMFKQYQVNNNDIVNCKTITSFISFLKDNVHYFADNINELICLSALQYKSTLECTFFPHSYRSEKMQQFNIYKSYNYGGNRFGFIAVGTKKNENGLPITTYPYYSDTIEGAKQLVYNNLEDYIAVRLRK